MWNHTNSELTVLRIVRTACIVDCNNFNFSTQMHNIVNVKYYFYDVLKYIFFHVSIQNFFHISLSSYSDVRWGVKCDNQRCSFLWYLREWHLKEARLSTTRYLRSVCYIFITIHVMLLNNWLFTLPYCEK